jgi:glycosyltransferase involved in cell wall biosynthesis
MIARGPISVLLGSLQHKDGEHGSAADCMNILFLVAHPIEDAGCRYRVYQFLPYLQSAGHVCTVWPFSTPRLFQALRSKGKLAEKVMQSACCSVRRALELTHLSKFDLVVIHREVFPFLTPLVEKLVFRRHPKVIFSLDDAIYAGHEDVSTLNHPILYRLKYGRGIDQVFRHSLHVIAGNRILAEYARHFNSCVSVIPTVVDCARYSSRTQTKGNLPITVGWVGSRSTAPYLKIIEPALISLAKKNVGKVRFRFFGCPEYRLDVCDFESLPFSLATETTDFESLDIGIMPLPDTEWTRGKCAFKAIQYMASGVATVASPIGITSDIVAHNVNGLLAKSTDEWFNALDLLVNDADARSRLALQARQTVEESYSLHVWGPKMVSLLEELSSPSYFRESFESKYAKPACDEYRHTQEVKLRLPV